MQSALAAVATYLIMQSLNPEEAFLAILSAVLIIQPSVGGTLGAAFTRLQATAVGSAISLGTVALLPDHWGVAAALAMSMLVVGGVAGLRPDWTYGAVAAVGIALASEPTILETAGGRGVAIAVGAATGVLISLLVWPDRAESRFERHFRKALRATATRLDDALEAATKEDQKAALPDHVSDYYKAVQSAQEALSAVKLADCAGMERRLNALRRLYNSIIILDRAADAQVNPASGSRSLVDQVSALRCSACATLNALADGKVEADRGVGRMDEAVRQSQSLLAQDDPATKLHRNRSVLTFGLYEVRQTLSELVEVSRG